MSKHTPGPWTIEGPNQYGGWWIKQPGLAGFSVSLIGSKDSPTHNTEANARLIAAAPELLEALKSIYTPFCNLVDLMNRFHPEGLTAEEYLRFMAMVQRIHYAICKAEGRL